MTRAKAGEARGQVIQLAETSKSRAANLKTRAVEVASDRQVQVTVASATAGGVAGGAGAGLLGGVAGAAAGLVPALFTFGLSIPAGFVMGASAGVVVGSTTGAAAGGVAGYGTYKHRSEIKSETDKAWLKANKYADL